MIELCRDAFRRAQPKSITVANRTLERGAQLAARFGAEAITLNELPERLPEFDIIVTCTASTLPILGKGTARARDQGAPARARVHRRPRGAARRRARGGELDDVFLYSVDDLSNIVKDNLQIRASRVAQAEEMIAEQTRQFPALAGRPRRVVPTITALHGHHDELRAAELERARKLLAGGTRRSRCWKRSRAGSPTSSCTRRRRR